MNKHEIEGFCDEFCKEGKVKLLKRIGHAFKALRGKLNPADLAHAQKASNLGLGSKEYASYRLGKMTAGKAVGRKKKWYDKAVSFAKKNPAVAASTAYVAGEADPLSDKKKSGLGFRITP